jgi:hypothetical protein
MEIILTIIIITVAVLAMSIGLLVNKPLKGSCGGQSGICPVCGDKADKCESNE